MAPPDDCAGSLATLAALTGRLVQADDLDARLTIALRGLADGFGIAHSMVLVPAGDRQLVTLASFGYPPGWVGAAVALGEGTIGVAAERRRTVRVGHLGRGLNMARAMFPPPPGDAPERSVPFVGIVNVHSQLAVPIVCGDELLGVVYAEDTACGRFGAREADAVAIVANALAVFLKHDAALAPEARRAPDAAPPAAGDGAFTVRYYEADSSVFFDGRYVIKSAPGRVLWKLLREYVERGSTELTSKELRLDGALALPAYRDNLDARLVLLRRRLSVRFPFVRITRVGRGCFRLEVDGRPLLDDVAGS